MPKSRKRKGHKQRLDKRNENIKTAFEKAQKEAWEKFEEWKKMQSEPIKSEIKFPNA